MSDQLLFSRLPRNLTMWRNRQVKKRILNEYPTLIRGLVGSRWMIIKVSAKLRFGCEWGSRITHMGKTEHAPSDQGTTMHLVLFDIILTMIDATNDAHVGLWESVLPGGKKIRS